MVIYFYVFQEKLVNLHDVNPKVQPPPQHWTQALFPIKSFITDFNDKAKSISVLVCGQLKFLWLKCLSD